MLGSLTGCSESSLRICGVSSTDTGTPASGWQTSASITPKAPHVPGGMRYNPRCVMVLNAAFWAFQLWYSTPPWTLQPLLTNSTSAVGQGGPDFLT